jgi:hypothetical protein
MTFIKLFEEFTETPKNTPLIYKDDNLEVKVATTFDSSKEQGKSTNWCSNNKGGFYSHNKTANMFRFNFSDGYKLRLTWDYITQRASHLGSYSGGTHWGQGGIVDGEKQYYDVFRPEDDSEPFLIDWKSDEKREIVDRIQSIPQEAIDKVHQYQDKMSRYKSENLNKMYKEIEKIRVIDVEETKSDSDWYDNSFKITITYLGKEYKLEMFFNSKDRCGFRSDEFDKAFKHKYVKYGRELSSYLFDKTMEFCKKNNISINKSSFKERDDEFDDD